MTVKFCSHSVRLLCAIELIVMICSSFLISILFVVIVDLLGFCEGAPLQSEQVLLIVSYDGFRPEYLNRNVTPNLNKFHSEGTSARFMLPVFPTKTFVNHFTIATVIFLHIVTIRCFFLTNSKFPMK